jgi:hypothetical protein
MARVGQIIEHPLTGERVTFLETAASTGGEKLRIGIEMAPLAARCRAATLTPVPRNDSWSQPAGCR